MFFEGDVEVDELKKFLNVLIYLGFVIVFIIVFLRIVDYFWFEFENLKSLRFESC